MNTKSCPYTAYCHNRSAASVCLGLVSCWLLILTGCNDQQAGAPSAGTPGQPVAPAAPPPPPPPTATPAPSPASNKQGTKKPTPKPKTAAANTPSVPKKLAWPTEAEQTIDPALLQEAQALFAGDAPHALPKAATAGQLQRLVRDWCRDLFVKNYEKYGKMDARWDTQVINCMEEHAKRFSNQPDAKSAYELNQLCNATFKSGCRDPLFYYLMARVRFLVGPQQDLSSSFQYSKLAVKQLKETEYPASVKFLVQYQYLLTGVQEPATLPEYLDDAVQLAAAAAAEPMPEGHRRALVYLFSQAVEVGMVERRTELVEALLANPQADPWIARIVAAREQVRQGWAARGKGYANTVTPEGWKELNGRLAAAGRLLLEARKLHPDHPEAAASLITVGAGGETTVPGTPRQWFDQAVQAELDYEPAYSSMWNYLRPRWGGSHEEMIALGRECLATGRFDTRVPWQFHRAVKAIVADLPTEKRAFYRTPGLYEDYRTMLRGYLAADSAGEKTNELRTTMMCVAWLAGKEDDAKQMAAYLGQNVVSSAFFEFGTTLSEFRKSLGLVRPETRVEKFARYPGLTSVALSPDGKTLFTAGAADIHKWEVATGKELSKLAGHTANVNVLAVSSDGKWLASGDQQGTVRIWDTAAGREERLLKLSGKVSALSWSHNGSHLATASFDARGDGEVVLWKMPAAERAAESALSSRCVLCLEFSSDDGRLVAAVLPDAPDGKYRGELTLWDVRSAQQLKTLQPFEGPVNWAAFSPDGSQLAIVGSERHVHQGRNYTRAYVRLLDAETGEQRQNMIGHDFAALRVSFLHNGKALVSSSEDKTVRLWDVASGRMTGLLQGHETAVMGLASDTAGSVLITADAGGGVLDWDIAEATFRSRIQGDLGRFVLKGGVKELRLLPKGEGLMVTAMQRGTSLWKAADGYRVGLMLPAPIANETIDADIAPDGRTLGAVYFTFDRTQTSSALIDVDTGRDRMQLPDPPRGPHSALRFSPDGASIACGDGGGRLVLYNSQTVQPWPNWGILAERGPGIGRLAFSRDGRQLLASADNGTVRLWQLPSDPQQAAEKLKPTRPLTFKETVQCLAWSADASKFAVGCSETAVFDANSQKQLFTVPGQEAAFSPDGSLLATAGGKLGSDAALWDAATGEERLRLLGGHTCNLWAIVFTADGNHVVTGDANGNLCLWDAQSGEEIPNFGELPMTSR